MRGDYESSYRALVDHIHGTVLPGLDAQLGSDARWNAQQGDLVLSFAENLIKEDDLACAKSELEAWQPLSLASPSTMEKIIVQSRDVTLARILKNEGRFKEALPCFERLFKAASFEMSHVSTGWQMIMFSNIADVYCEVGRLEDAEAVLETELQVVFSKGWENISTGRRLQLALIESFIRRGMFVKAEECLVKLIPVFEAITEPDVLQNTGHFRVWIGLVRISHLQGKWDDALLRWHRALGIVESSGWQKGFTYGVILYSISQVLFHTKSIQESYATLENAKKSFAIEERKYWIVGLGSYWYDYVVTDLGAEGPDPVIRQQQRDSREKARDCFVDQIFGPWGAESLTAAGAEVARKPLPSNFSLQSLSMASGELSHKPSPTHFTLQTS
jgi:tetratricopeptide (TPR) repeat protein